MTTNVITAIRILNEVELEMRKGKLVPDWAAVFFAAFFAGSKGLLRTQLQKILYFASQKGILEDSFDPSYFGPFSPNIANSAESLVNKNFLDEGIEYYFPGTIGYRYNLSHDGEKVISTLRERFARANVKGLREVIAICKNQETRSLSIAAKVHYILKSMGIPMTSEEITVQAKKLNWDLSGDEVKAASKLLRDLDLIKE